MSKTEQIVLGALPGTCTEVALRTEMKTNTVQKIIRRLRDQMVVVVGGYKKREKGARNDSMIFVLYTESLPETGIEVQSQFKTAWIGGGYPLMKLKEAA